MLQLIHFYINICIYYIYKGVLHGIVLETNKNLVKTCVLERLYKCIDNNNVTISVNDNRMDNLKFMETYQLKTQDIFNMLKELRPEDFCKDDPDYIFLVKTIY